MVDSRVGRTERRNLGQRWAELRTRPEAEHCDVRKPATGFALVHAEAFEMLPDRERQPLRPPELVREDEHRDAACLPVAQRREHDRLFGQANSLSERLCDCLELRSRSSAEEGEREVEVRALDPSRVAAEGGALPCIESGSHASREGEAAEESQTITAVNATRGRHAGLFGLCAKTRRARWRAATVARRRIDSRSPG